MRRRWRPAASRNPCRARRRSGRCATTFPAPTRAATSRPTSPSTCFRSSTKTRDNVCGTTRRRVTRRSAAARRRRSTNTRTPMSELARHIERYEQELARTSASPHTLTAYSADLRQFLEFLSPPGAEPPEPAAIDLLAVREWLAFLYREKLDVMTVRRKLAAVRSFFKFLVTEGIVP